MIIKEFPLSKLFTELVLPPIPVSILCCISIWILSGYKTDFHKAEKYFLTSYLIGMVLQTGSYVIVFPLLIAVTIAELKNSKDMMDTLKVLMAIFSIYFVEVMLKALNGAYFYWKDSSRIKNYAMVYAVVLAGVFLISILKNTVFKGRNRYAKDSLWRARLRLMFALSIPIMVSIRLIYPYVNSRSYGSFSFVIDWYIPIAIPLFSIVLILFIIYNYEKSIGIQVELKREVEERHRLEEYASVVEEMYGQTRKFKHDYKNMLLPLKGYIDSEDTKGLKKFFYENVMHIDDHINWSSTNIDKLGYIRISALKALISAKLIKALSKNIDVRVEIVENISRVDMNIMDLCRIAGILMDNALEGAEKCDTPRLYFCAFNRGSYVVLVFKNNFKGEKPVIHKIWEKGFSTKGEDRGLGLYTVKNIIDEKYNNVFMNTSVEDSQFIQELWIKDTTSPT